MTDKAKKKTNSSAKMQHQLNISKISAISNEFAKGKVTLCGWEKTSVVEPAVYINKHVVAPNPHL